MKALLDIPPDLEESLAKLLQICYEEQKYFPALPPLLPAALPPLTPEEHIKYNREFYNILHQEGKDAALAFAAASLESRKAAHEKARLTAKALRDAAKHDGRKLGKYTLILKLLREAVDDKLAEYSAKGA
jgi:hypothetical protein